LTLHFTDRFDVQLGGRESFIREVIGPATTTGGFVTAVIKIPSGVEYTAASIAADSPFTYLLTPQFRISPDWMVYARLSSGFRPGGANTIYPGNPPTYGPDKTKNYEVGTKGDLLGGSVTFDASLYYIDWAGLQIGLVNTVGYTTNVGSAKSDGVELSLSWRPAAGMAFSGWMDYDDAELTADFPYNSQVYGVSGERLPGVATFAAGLSANYTFPLRDGFNGFVGSDASYQGDRLGTFNPTPPRQIFPSYTKTDLHAGVKSDGWTVNLYVNNLANVRALIGGGLGAILPGQDYYITPRTVGVNVAKSL
jgi:iron complex outermembrane receptor protein